MKVLEDTPAVLSPPKLCDEHRYSYEWINGRKPHLNQDGFRIQCNTENFVPIVVLGLSSSSSSNLPSSTSMTPSRQETDHPTTSSSSSTFTNHNCVKRQWDSRKGRSEWDRFPSSEHVERKERGDPLTKPTKNPKPKKKRRPRGRTERPVSFRHTGVAARIQRKSCAWQSSWMQRLTRQFFS